MESVKESVEEYTSFVDGFLKKLKTFKEDLWEDVLYDLLCPEIMGGNAKTTPRRRKGYSDYMKAEEDIQSKIGLVDSSLVKFPVGDLANHSLRNLESEIKKGNKRKIKEMFENHEQLVRILKPHENLRYFIISEGPIYSKEHDKKYHKLKTKFLTAA